MAEFVNIVPGRLWQVTDLLPNDELTNVLSTDWLALHLHASSGQESWTNRKQVAWDDPIIRRIGQYINNQLPQINQALGTTFTQSGGHFWIDYPGFTVNMHTDGHVPNAMHLYWTMPNDSLDYGTGFYHFKNKDSLLYQFDSSPNTGYIMLNHVDEDGSQPLQWHGMFNPVPQATVRVTSYWQFN